MKLAVTFLLLMISGVCAAEIYRVIGPDGGVTYTDEPPADARNYERLELQESSSGIESPPRARIEFSNSQPAPEPYSRFRITAPEDGTSVRANDGDFPVRLELDPTLNRRAGHRVALLMDGELVSEGESLTHGLHNVNRGTHELVAEIRSAAGAVLVRSAPVVITLHRAAVGDAVRNRAPVHTPAVPNRAPVQAP